MDERLIEVKSLINKGDLGAALALAGRIDDPYWRDYALRWVAEAYAQENPGKALEVAGKIATESLRDEVFRDLSYIFSKNWMFKPAIEASKKIRSEFVRKKALKAVSAMLARAIVEKGSAGMSLSELGLDEGDIEVLKPLPPGISLKNGKLMPGAELLRMKGEFRNAVVSQNEVAKVAPPKPSVKPLEPQLGGYLVGYFKLIADLANAEELQYWASLVGEPLRSRLLEDLGLIYLKSGNFEKAAEIYEKASRVSQLGFLLALKCLENGDAKRAVEFAEKIADPVKRVVLLEEMLRRGFLDEELARKVLTPKSDYVLARLLKFFAFELLEESKMRNDSELRELSKRIFDLGVKIQREYEARLF
ncbi:hypothetical protein A3L09_04300 [Thermococcus profundus]|uniref:Uncharacterized protein n=1 Tax=Thermococcus profundus TaxID=49899 RepID=A0A2Z2M7W4_THEPR|nr:hypothetical protein A3L09_04300 [Thermococcus profundus]